MARHSPTIPVQAGTHFSHGSRPPSGWAQRWRGGGLGNRIMALAEEEARRRGCTAAFVYTVTFQAPGFYEHHGYRRFGEIACPPDGATRILLTKPLGQVACSASDHRSMSR